MKHEVLQALLIDVRDLGSARIEARKLAWMLGRKNLNATAFELLMAEWRQIAPENLELHGFEWYGEYALTVQPVEKVSKWVA